jgi:hypothetical protein
VVSTLITLLCIGIAVRMIWSGRGRLQWVALLPLGMVCGGALFNIRGYSVTPEAILVHRLFWTTRLSLAGLQSARFEPNAMCWSLRTFENSGLFSFTGFFRSNALGAYRAFVTDPHQTFVLQFATRTVVVSPSPPEEFVHDIGITAQAG